MEQARTLLRELPSVDRLLQHSQSAPLLERFNRDYITQKCREILDELRIAVREGKGVGPGDLKEESILARLERRVASDSNPKLVRVVNATGTILHTNLGRALLPEAALQAAEQVGRYPVNLEYDLARGKRGKREEAIEHLLVDLTGAEAGTVVNNNAAAVLLTLNALAEGGEVIVSRGELIEIGGSFRIAEIMAKSGALLREVGTTNRTRIGDYRKAINERTKLLLRVHPSNFRVVGFTERPGLDDLVALSREAGIPLFEDLGSGCLVPM
ncbi:MAG: L-seryl-tRNA(Sec) selenium transferase, partial [Candidatus Binatia bacterium]